MVMFAACLSLPQAPQASKAEREAGHQILNQVAYDLRHFYYDTRLRGVDLDSSLKAAHSSIDGAANISQIWGIIEEVLLKFNDSHTFFIPPPWTFRVDYGFSIQIVGDRCLITEVEPRSDAEAKGLLPGDEVYSIDGIWPTRDNMWKFEYLYHTLRPKKGMKVVIQKSDGSQPDFEVQAKTTPSHAIGSTFELYNRMKFGPNRRNAHYRDLGDSTIYWRLPTFTAPDEVEDGIKRIRKYGSLILDLRGNGGGYEKTLAALLGALFENDVKIADRKTRAGITSSKAQGSGKDAFRGKLVVLIDSDCASAAEIFPRVIQLEHRGAVIGDRTSGLVMEALRHNHSVGSVSMLLYGESITEADLIMSDGKSLERVGVTPDETVLPSASDLKEGRDPVLSRAAQLVGVTLSPTDAARIVKDESKKK